MDYINLIRTSSVNIQSSKSYYKIVDSSVRKCVYRVIYVEDRYTPNILYLSIYDKNYKSDYKINRVVNGGSTTTFKFLYDDLGSIYFCKEDGTRGGVLSLQLLSGDTQAKIENVNSADGTEIPIL